jgi:hypothetical protein
MEAAKHVTITSVAGEAPSVAANAGEAAAENDGEAAVENEEKHEET